MRTLARLVAAKFLLDAGIEVLFAEASEAADNFEKKRRGCRTSLSRRTGQPKAASSRWCSAATARSCEAAELARPHDVPLLGVNLGHVGFLAEARGRRGQLRRPGRGRIDAGRSRSARLCEVVVRLDGVELDRTWALNEASVEKCSRERMLEVMVEVDDRPLSRWGRHGVGGRRHRPGRPPMRSRAGGPVVWPEVECAAGRADQRPRALRAPTRCTP